MLHAHAIGPQVVGECEHLQSVLTALGSGMPCPFELDKLAELLADAAAGNKRATRGAREVRLCSCCHAAETSQKKLSACSGCKVALYCSRECQRRDWRAGHKHTCAAPLARRAAA